MAEITRITGNDDEVFVYDSGETYKVNFKTVVAILEALSGASRLSADAIKDGSSGSIHAQNTDTQLGTMAANIAMGTHKLTGLSVPNSAGDSIRATATVTESDLEDAINKKHTNQFEIVEATRDMTTATGTQNIVTTFEPSMVKIEAAINADNVASWGSDDGTEHVVIYMAYNDLFYGLSTHSIYLVADSGARQEATISALTSSQLTLSWTKTGSPTGTAYIKLTLFA